jgi:hypothetical protein
MNNLWGFAIWALMSANRHQTAAAHRIPINKHVHKRNSGQQHLLSATSIHKLLLQLKRQVVWQALVEKSV